VSRDDREVRRLGPADSFGEVALLEPGPRTATVTAAAPTRLLVLDREVFVAAVSGHLPTDDLARRGVAVLRSADEERSTRPPGEDDPIGR
jgi:CRP-like cAMP-binding protein